MKPNSPGGDSHTYSQLIFDSGAKQSTRGNDYLLTNEASTTEYMQNKF